MYADLSPVRQFRSTHRPDFIGKNYICHWDHENNIPLVHNGDHTHEIVDAYFYEDEDHISHGICLFLDNGEHIKGINEKYIRCD